MARVLHGDPSLFSPKCSVTSSTLTGGGLPWMRGEEAEESFGKWCRGETGFPIVDAGMRQLAATGFMHNRVRMIVSMFLTKDLHIDWRMGEAFFHALAGRRGDCQ